MNDNWSLPDYSGSRAVLIGTWEYAHLPPVHAAQNSLQRIKALMTGDLCGWPTKSITVVPNRRKPGDLPDKLMELFSRTDRHGVALSTTWATASRTITTGYAWGWWTHARRPSAAPPRACASATCGMRCAEAPPRRRSWCLIAASPGWQLARTRWPQALLRAWCAARGPTPWPPAGRITPHGSRPLRQVRGHRPSSRTTWQTSSR